MRWLLLMWMVSCGPSTSVTDTDTDLPVDSDDTDDTDDTDVTDTQPDADTDTDTDTDTDMDTDTLPSSALLEELLPVSGAGEDAFDASREWAVRIAPGAATIEVVELWLRGSGVSDTGTDLVVEIHDGSAGIPSGTALASVTVEGSTIAGTADWVVVNFPRGVEVGAGAAFVVLRTSGGRGSFTGFPQSTPDEGQLALREVPGAWERYGKPYDWAHRVWGVAK